MTLYGSAFQVSADSWQLESWILKIATVALLWYLSVVVHFLYGTQLIATEIILSLLLFILLYFPYFFQ